MGFFVIEGGVFDVGVEVVVWCWFEYYVNVYVGFG